MFQWNEKRFIWKSYIVYPNLFFNWSCQNWMSLLQMISKFYIKINIHKLEINVGQALKELIYIKFLVSKLDTIPNNCFFFLLISRDIDFFHDISFDVKGKYIMKKNRER